MSEDVMDPVTNPYTPGAGRRPVALVGRDSELANWETGLRRVEAGRTAQPAVHYGLRGVGKTVLLSQLGRVATQRDWIVARIDAGTGKTLRELLGEALHGPLTDLARPSAGARIRRALKTAASFKASYDTSGGTWNFGLDLSESAGGGADTGYLESDVTKLVRDVAGAAEEASTGLAVLVDEAQDLASDELQAVCSIVHLAGQDGWRLHLALAGLPSLPRVLTEAKSYAERLFTYAPIQHLDDELARQTLVAPAATERVRWDDDAAALVVRASSGYPYFLQQLGQDTWNEAAGPDIALDDARVGVAAGRLALDSGFFRARWDRATRAEQRYLRAMAEDADRGSGSGDVAARLGGSAASFGPARANLIAKGLIYAPEHGVVAFTVPGMADFIQRQPTT